MSSSVDKKRIAVVSSGHIPSYFAHSINTVKHASALSELGHAVELLTVERRSERLHGLCLPHIFKHYGTSPVPIRFFPDRSPFVWDTNAHWIGILTRINNIFLGRLKAWRDPERSVSDYIGGNNFHLCYARSYRIVSYNIARSIPTIIESHNPNPGQSKELMNALSFAKSKYFLGIVTIHEKLRQNFIRLGVPPEKTLALEDAVDLEQFDLVSDDTPLNRDKLNLPMRKKIVMYCGSLKPGKGMGIILDTAYKLKQHKDFHFYVVGGNQKEVGHYKELSKGLDNITFTGFVDGSMVPVFLKGADILFMPYDLQEKTRVMDLETTSPIKLFEYMAAKKPIITTDIPTIRKVLTHEQHGMLIGDGEYAKTILELAGDEGLSQLLAQNAYSLAARYTYKARCEKILGLAKSLE